LKNSHSSFLLKCCLIVATSIACSFSSRGQSYSHLVFDGKQSQYFGADDLITLHHALYSFEDKYIPNKLFRENNFIKKTAGFGYRAIKLLILDAQLDCFIALTQHEVFGHGSRFREMGFKKNTFNLNLYWPFGDASGTSYYGTLKTGMKYPTAQEYIAINIGGVGGEKLMANNLTSQMLLEDTLHYRQGLLYLIAQNNLLLYLWDTRFTPTNKIKAGNDMMNFITGITNVYSHPVDRTYELKKLSLQSLVSFANPLQLYSAFSIIYTYGVKGQNQLNKIPMIRFGQVRYLPMLDYSFTPFGSLFHFVNYIRYKRMLFSGDFSLGDNTFKDFYGISLKGYNLLNTKIITLNGHLDFWNQPVLELDNYYKPTGGNAPGGAIKADVILRPFKLPNKLGLFLEAGYKTKGYIEGETLASSLILRYGISMHL